MNTPFGGVDKWFKTLVLKSKFDLSICKRLEKNLKNVDYIA